MPPKSPRCPDCSSPRVRSIVYGEPGAELSEQAKAGSLVLGGCLIGDESPSWDCPDCGNRFGSLNRPRARPRPRTAQEWAELIETMVPSPSRCGADGVITGGDPVTVLVRITDDEIQVLEPELVWDDPNVAAVKATPFAKVPWRAPATRVAELIILASAKRLSRYRWCPRCRATQEPERMLDSICHSCAERVLGVVF